MKPWVHSGNVFGNPTKTMTLFDIRSRCCVSILSHGLRRLRRASPGVWGNRSCILPSILPINFVLSALKRDWLKKDIKRLRFSLDALFYTRNIQENYNLISSLCTDLLSARQILI